MENKKIAKVLIVDDEKVVRYLLTRIVNLQSVEAKAVEDGFKAIEAVKEEKFDLVFLDIRMPKMDGIKAYGELKKIDPELDCVFMTGYALEESLLDKTKQPGVICLKKPFQDISQIKEIISSVLKKAWASAPIKGNIPERRAYVRLDMGLNIEYKVKDTQKINTRYKSKNISPGGVRFLFQEELLPGTIVDLTIKAPGASNTCKAAAEVVWNKEVVDKPGYFDTGLKFIEINVSELSACIMCNKLT